jgi:CTP-dependent riboflavin kinase
MKKKIIAILIAFGVAKAAAEKHTEKVPEEDDAEFDVDKLLSDFQDKQKDLLKNDPEFVKSVSDPAVAKTNDIWLSKFKQKTGLSAEEVKDKKTVEIIEAGVEKIRKKGDATTEQLQTENLALATELKKIKEEDLPAAKTEAETVRKRLELENKVAKSLPKIGKKIRVDEDVALITLNTKLAQRGIVLSVDENGELVAKTKDGLGVKNKDGTKLLNAIELFTEVLDEGKLLENSGAGDGGGTGGAGTSTITTQVDKDDKEKLYQQFPHLKAAEEHKEKIKADMEAAKNRK